MRIFFLIFLKYQLHFHLKINIFSTIENTFYSTILLMKNHLGFNEAYEIPRDKAYYPSSSSNLLFLLPFLGLILGLILDLILDL